MLKRLQFFVLFLILGCIEPYEFVVREQTPSLVIEAYLSDKSYSETLDYPSDGRYFTVRLSETGDVTNVRPVPVRGATVEMHRSDGLILLYTEEDRGIYRLLDPDFKAEKGFEYRLRVTTDSEEIYESSWESLPDIEEPAIGDVGFREDIDEVYVMEATEWVLKKKQVVVANISVPDNNTGREIYYRWSFSPIWIYVAPLVSQVDPVYRCWATDVNYLNTYALQVDRAGDYKKDLFSFPTIRNERIFEKFSVLVTQQAMREPYYNFWKEMKDRNDGGALTDVPPYNLRTNFVSESGSRRVSGYFGITSEQARRWYFDRKDLSYYVENTLLADCQVVYGPGPPAPECLNCTQYSFGQATTTKPSWWP